MFNKGESLDCNIHRNFFFCADTRNRGLSPIVTNRGLIVRDIQENEMPDFSIAIALLKKPIEDLYGFASEAMQKQIAIIRTQAKLNLLHKRLWESQRVKTIWHTDKPLSLSSFFYPVSIKSQGNVNIEPIKITNLSNLPNKHTIIFGTVGQGKSILLRYLLGREIKSGTHIPLLCELRNLESQSLITYLVERFAILVDLPPNEELFTYFATNGKIAFLLDGFDEINLEKVPKISQELEDLANRFNACHIAITSRPDSECRYLTSFHTVKIQELAVSDLEPFYKRIGHDAEFAKLLVSAINKSPTKIRELVTTPLLATLLAISYRAAQKIPLEFSEFYEELFQILLTRHDASKLGWQRGRKTKLNAREIQHVFEIFCFATRRKSFVVIDHDVAIDLAKECLQDANITMVDAQNVIDDIKRVTCLLVEEGKKYQFVHSSVQEFFAARYVKTRSEPVAASFYKQLSDRHLWISWQEELLFLKQIDSYRAAKYFFKQDLEKTLLIINTNVNTPADAAIKYLDGMAVVKKIEDRGGVPTPKYSVQRVRAEGLTYHLQIIDSRVFTQLFNGPWIKGFAADGTSTLRTYHQIAEDQGAQKYAEILALVATIITAQQNELQVLKRTIANEEKTTGLINLAV